MFACTSLLDLESLAVISMDLFIDGSGLFLWFFVGSWGLFHLTELQFEILSLSSIEIWTQN